MSVQDELEVKESKPAAERMLEEFDKLQLKRLRSSILRQLEARLELMETIDGILEEMDPDADDYLRDFSDGGVDHEQPCHYVLDANACDLDDVELLPGEVRILFAPCGKVLWRSGVCSGHASAELDEILRREIPGLGDPAPELKERH